MLSWFRLYPVPGWIEGIHQSWWKGDWKKDWCSLLTNLSPPSPKGAAIPGASPVSVCSADKTSHSQCFLFYCNSSEWVLNRLGPWPRINSLLYGNDISCHSLGPNPGQTHNNSFVAVVVNHCKRALFGIEYLCVPHQKLMKRQPILCSRSTIRQISCTFLCTTASSTFTVMLQKYSVGCVCVCAVLSLIGNTKMQAPTMFVIFLKQETSCWRELCRLKGLK